MRCVNGGKEITASGSKVPVRGVRGKILIPSVAAVAVIAVMLFLNGCGAGGKDSDTNRTPNAAGEYDEDVIPSAEDAGETEVIGQAAENRAGSDAEPGAPLIPDDAKTGDVITIEGTVYFDKTLQWRILGIEEGRALLITEDIIDMRPYNELTDRQVSLWLDENYSWNSDDFAVTWEECSLRTWLNEDFLKDFDTKAAGQILDTEVKNDDNPASGTPGGEDTTDKVFLLSIDEVNKYFASDEDRMAECQPNDQQLSDMAERISKNPWYKDLDLYGDAAAAKKELSEIFAASKGAGWWWLRSPGSDDGSHAADVGRGGNVDTLGDYVPYGGGGVRPALYLNIEK